MIVHSSSHFLFSRCVDEQDKAMSLGLSAFLSQLLGKYCHNNNK